MIKRMKSTRKYLSQFKEETQRFKGMFTMIRKIQPLDQVTNTMRTIKGNNSTIMNKPLEN
jgi:hypothetical protein